MIKDIEVKSLRVVPDERGRLVEILRSDSNLFFKFGQVYMTTTYPGTVKAWHLHKKQTDNVACIHGMIKLVLFDSRKDSSSFKEINEFYLGIHTPMIILIPPGVFHGWMCVSEEEAIIINVPTEVYNYDAPDEYRQDPHDNDIPYDWKRKDG